MSARVCFQLARRAFRSHAQEAVLHRTYPLRAWNSSKAKPESLAITSLDSDVTTVSNTLIPLSGESKDASDPKTKRFTLRRQRSAIAVKEQAPIFSGEEDEVLFIPLGGCSEIGMNSYMYGYRGKWIMVDLGVRFGDSSVPLGVDFKMPDIQFIDERKDDLVGLLLTHSHEDHIGNSSFLLAGSEV
jgi:hypothetical protein